jgi:hypothetical protein
MACFFQRLFLLLVCFAWHDRLLQAKTSLALVIIACLLKLGFCCPCFVLRFLSKN